LQVHARHTICNGDRFSGRTCNCAVAVREGNEIIAINNCTGTTTLIEYLSAKTMSIEDYKNGSYKVSYI